MKVLIIPSWYPCKAYPYAGRFIVEQAKALANTGRIDVSVLNWGQNEHQIRLRKPFLAMFQLIRFIFNGKVSSFRRDGFHEVRIPHLTWTSHFLSGNIRSLALKLHGMEKPDLIHAHVSFPGGFLAMQLASHFRIPYLITEHSGPFPFPEFRIKDGLSPLITAPLAGATQIIAVSSFLKEEIRKWIAREVAVIPNLVDTGFFTPQDRTSPNQVFTFFALASMISSKGMLDLVKAVQILLKHRSNFILHLGGEGPLRKRIAKSLAKHSLDTHIKLLGALNPDQALHHYRTCDCFVMPSHLETFGVVLIEALSCGKPIIATDCGGPRDIVQDSCGRLVSAHDPCELASAMESVIEERSSYNAESIRDYCVKRFGHETVTTHLIELYRRCITQA